MTDKEILPLKAARKLNMLILHNEALANDKSLQEKIITWAEDMLKEARADWSDMRQTTLSSIIKIHQRTNARKGGVERDKKYIQFREEFAKIQKEYFIRTYQNNQKLTASSFVEWFISNKSKEIKIPYVPQNQKNKLRQLAQANAREFKKLLHGKS